MAKRKQTAKAKQVQELDSAYLLKIIFMLVLGSFWVRVVSQNGTEIPLPVGFVVGIFFTMHERFQIDRKIEYAILLMAMFLGFWLPIGISITR